MDVDSIVENYGYHASAIDEPKNRKFVRDKDRYVSFIEINKTQSMFVRIKLKRLYFFSNEKSFSTTIVNKRCYDSKIKDTLPRLIRDEAKTAICEKYGLWSFRCNLLREEDKEKYDTTYTLDRPEFSDLVSIQYLELEYGLKFLFGTRESAVVARTEMIDSPVFKDRVSFSDITIEL